MPEKITQLNGPEHWEPFFWVSHTQVAHTEALQASPTAQTGQLPEGESAFAQGGSGCPCEQLNSENMADVARPAQQLWVSNTLGLIFPYFTLPPATLKVTSPIQTPSFNNLTDTNFAMCSFIAT